MTATERIQLILKTQQIKFPKVGVRKENISDNMKPSTNREKLSKYKGKIPKL
jgi:hypothetical protein